MEDKNLTDSDIDFYYSYIAITNIFKSPTKFSGKELYKEIKMLKKNFDNEEIKAMTKTRMKNEDKKL